MKLRNKKTGEIVDGGYIRESNDFYRNGKRVIAVFVRDGDFPPKRVSIGYETLAKLNEEWEDYEEPKEYWYIDCYGMVLRSLYNGNEWDERRKLIGNYFETKEEAEKAVEKLKAWKRLKDEGIIFKNWTINQTGTVDCFATWGDNIPPSRKNPTLLDDIDLLFGGEE